MKFSSLQENLKQGLFVVSHIAGKNPNLPILNNIMIEAKQGNIKLISTNLEIGISCLIRGKVEKEGSYTIDSKIFSDYINILPTNKKVDVELSENNISVVCENYKTKIKGQSSEEYPLIPTIDREGAYKVSANDFKKAISQVVFAASPSETRIELAGVLFIFDNNELILAATDSYRLAEKRIKTKTESAEQADVKKIIIPTKTIQEVNRILSGAREEVGVENDEIEIYVLENQVLFVYGTAEIVSRLIEGQYPDYKQIIPNFNKTNLLVDVNQLMRAVKASALFSKSGINDINLDFPKDKQELVISSTSGQAGENITNLEAVINGDDNGMVVNYRYLLDGLNNINEERVKIEVVDGNTPCVLRPEKDDSYLYIVMPIKQ